MNPDKKKVLSDKEIVKNLIKYAKVLRPVAEVLVHYLRNPGATTQHHIQQTTRLKQPEVSIALSTLKGWIDQSRRKKRPGKGRPTTLYDLPNPVEAIGSFIADARKELEIAAGNLDLLLQEVG